MEWQMIGREAEVAQVHRALRSHKGVVIVGRAGVGKTRLLREVVASVRPRVYWVSATGATETIPFGPLVPAIPGLADALATRGTAGALERAQAVLAAEEGGCVLAVDDGHRLDAGSAAVVYQLAAAGTVPVIVTVRFPGAVPDAVTALWKDAGLLRLELGALSPQEAGEMAVSVLGGTIERATESKFWQLSQGNPLELRELLVAAKEAGVLDPGVEGWTLTGPINVSGRLSELIEKRLKRLATPAREAAELIAYAEPLQVELLHRTVSDSTLDQLDRAHVISDLSPDVQALKLAHPLYGEVLRHQLTALQRLRLARRLVAVVEELGEQLDPLRVAAWQLDGDTGTAEDLAAGAALAYGRMDFDLAIRLGEASLVREPSQRAHNVVAATLAVRGDTDGAERHLRALIGLARNPLEETWTEIALADLWFFYAGRATDAIELLRSRRLSSADRECRAELSAGLAYLLTSYGDLDEEVPSLVDSVLTSTEANDRSRMLALVSLTVHHSLSLHAAAPDVAADAAGAAEKHRSRLPNGPFVVGTSQSLTDVFDGRPDTARNRIQSMSPEAAANEDRALWMSVHTQILLYEGFAEASHAAGVEALQVLSGTDVGLARSYAASTAAYAAASCNRREQALYHLQEAEGSMVAPRVRTRMELALAMITATEHGLKAAAAAAVAAGEAAADHGLMAYAAELYHMAVRLGHAEGAVDQLEKLRVARPRRLVELFATHATAFHSGDAPQLTAVADQFAAAGFGLFAAETAAQASRAWRLTGVASAARRSAAHARELLPEGSGAQTPALVELTDAPALTPREREIALLAARGMTSPEISRRLHLSVRSVDNRLGSVYQKLGVSGRTELPEIFATGMVNGPARDGTR